MKKRTIKQQVKYADEQVLERNKDFHDQLVARHFAENKTRYRKRVFIGTGSAIATVVAAVILCVILLSPPADGKKLYLLKNEVITNTEIAQLNSDVGDVNFEIAEHFSSEIKRVYDSFYNETLYYHIFLTSSSTFETISIFVYANPDFPRQQALESQPTLIVIGGFNVNYHKNIEQDDLDLGFNIVKYVALTEYKGVKIYVEHEQFSVNEESNFALTFEQTIKKV